MEIREIFENLIKIEPKVMAIESLFNNEDRVNKTNYKPPYQRNYVWDDEKATYFIESILLGTEIPPLIYFRSGDKVEVIDGRQRYETIIRFIRNEFKLKKNGLQKLEDIGIANKYFKDLGDLRDIFWDTKLRIIEFSFHTKNLIDDEIEDKVKKEIFKRYNSGITPLKPTDIDKATYFEDDLNTFIRKKLQSDRVLYGDVTSIFHFEKPNIEVLLKKIRQLLVQHQIPIKYYSVKKELVIAKYYDFLFSKMEYGEIENIYSSFIVKINLLKRIKKVFSSKGYEYNRLIFECLFWAFSIMEEEQLSLNLLTDEIITELSAFLHKGFEVFVMDRSSFAKELDARYTKTAEFFEEKFNLDYTIYLKTTTEFKEKNKRIQPETQERISFDDLRINKPEPSSIAILDITRQMEKHRFLIRPPYQRNEVINKKKSSSIIESILLGIKLPPIFVFKRIDGISEVLDGQQRLLSILGYIEKKYLNENNAITESNKHGFALNLKNSILTNLNTKKFKDLPQDFKAKIENFDLWIIEISQKNNENFEPIDLFVRLNNKPYPIKENTFEMWNSYISKDIIEYIKNIHTRHKAWFYFRKNNSRMEDENIYTSLSYLQFGIIRNGHSNENIFKDLDIYKVVNKINFRIKSKNEISKVLEDAECKSDFIKACSEFEKFFIEKLKILVSDDNDDTTNTLNKNLDFVLNAERGRRTQQSFYALWFFLSNVTLGAILKHKLDIREKLRELSILMSDTDNRLNFDNKIETFWNIYK